MKKIIIIGAGPAGLTAALEIVNSEIFSRQQISLTVLEASDSVGGLAKTVLWQDRFLDIGGHRFFTKDPEIAEWWEMRSRKHGNFLETRERKVKILFEDKLYDYPVRLSRETLHSLGLLRTVGIGIGYLAVRCIPKTETSLEDFYVNRFGRPLYELFFQEYTEKLCGESAVRISPEWGMQRVRGLSIREILKSKRREKTPDLFRYPKEGPGAMWTAVADEISEKGGEIRLGCAVERVLASGTRVTGVELSSGERLDADAIISTMPLPKLIRAIRLTDANPRDEQTLQQMQRIAADLKYRSVICVAVETSHSACRNILDNTWIYTQNPGLKLGRVQIYNSWFNTPKEPVLLGLEFFCNEGDDFWKLADEDWIKLALHDGYQAGIFQNESDKMIHSAAVIRVKDAYPSYSGSYGEKGRLTEFVGGIDGLQTAGRGGTHSYWNMDRAMENAMACAKRITEK